VFLTKAMPISNKPIPIDQCSIWSKFRGRRFILKVTYTIFSILYKLHNTS